MDFWKIHRQKTEEKNAYNNLLRPYFFLSHAFLEKKKAVKKLKSFCC